MRYLLSICALFLLTATFIAQTPTKVENWQVFSPISDEFSVDAPLPLEQRGDNDPKTSRKYYGSINGVYVYIFSDPVKTQSYYASVRDILPKIGQTADLIPKDEDSSSSVSFKDTFGYWHNLTTLRTETRVYVAQTVTLNEKSEVASHFIKSFGVGSRRPFVPVAGPITEQKNDELKVVPATKNGRQGAGSGSGSGPGADTGSGGTTGSIQAAPASSQLSGIRILTKARPSYTDIARIYEISATVILRVTFLASGEIGTIRPVTQAPFGLTEKAVEAARRITFEPAYLNGSPQSVTKQIEYSFSIY